MPRENVDNLLAKYHDNDFSAKLVHGVLGVVPFAPKFNFYRTIDDCARTVAPTITNQQLTRAKEIAKSEDIEEALWVCDCLDTGDKGIAMYSGVKSAFQLFFSNSEKNPNRFETDPQQAADAGLKALGMCYVVAKMMPGSFVEKVQLFNKIPAGQTMELYYAALEVVVPFTDNVLQGGGQAITQLMEKFGGNDQAKRLTEAAGNAAAAQAQGVLAQIMGSLNGVSHKLLEFVGPMSEKAKQHMPGILNTTDKVAGAIATGADFLPVWGLLGSRLAAETSVIRAVRGL